MSEAAAGAPIAEASAPTPSAPVADTSTNQAPVADAPTTEAPATEATQSQPVHSGDLLSSHSSSAEALPVDGLNPSNAEPTEPTHWLDGMPADLRDNPNINKYQSQEDLLIGFNNLSKKLGEKGVVKPEADAPQEVKDAWLDHLGRPVNPDGYEEYKPKTGLDSEGNEVELYKVDPEMYKGAKDLFHSIGLDQEQHNALMDYLVDYELSQHQQTEAYNNQQSVDAIGQLKQEYGIEYDSKIRSAVNISNALGIRETLISEGLGSNPTIIRMLNQIGEKIGESRLTGDTVNSLDSIDSQIDNVYKLMAETPKSSPNYQQLNTKLMNLFAKKV